MQDKHPTINRRQTAIIIIVLFAIAPLVIAIIFAFRQVVTHISVEEALQSNVEEGVIQTLAEENNFDPNTNVIHQIATDGDYLAVSLSSTSPDSLGNGATAVLKKQGDSYQTIYIGTGYDKKTLTNAGVPNGLAEKITTTNLTSEYNEIIHDSYLNPEGKYSLIKDLPFYTDKLAISYHYRDNLKDSDGISIPIIEISATNAANRSLGLSKIRSFGYDPGEYRIVFRNLKNPFVPELEEKETVIERVNEENQGP